MSVHPGFSNLPLLNPELFNSIQNSRNCFKPFLGEGVEKKVGLKNAASGRLTWKLCKCEHVKKVFFPNF
jgi:hypothetical protein